MRRVLAIAAVAEAATGMALLVVPEAVGRLLLGEELAGAGIPAARVLGLALFALGVVCWPGPPSVGMFIYTAAAGVYLAYVGIAGGFDGILLWPAVIVHMTLAALLAWTSRRCKCGHTTTE